MPTSAQIIAAPALTVSQGQHLLALLRASEAYRANVGAYPDLQAVLWAEVNRKFAITGATNAAPIVLTATAHGFAVDESVYAESVGGNTAANGEWLVDAPTTNALTLLGSTGNAAYTSGGLLTSLKSKQLAAIVEALDCLGEGTEALKGGKEGLDYSAVRDREALLQEALSLLYSFETLNAGQYLVGQRGVCLHQHTRPYAY